MDKDYLLEKQKFGKVALEWRSEAEAHCKWGYKGYECTVRVDEIWFCVNHGGAKGRDGIQGSPL